ncbi:MAG: hypothetical protein CM15mP103_03830 [Gammaproteobacteria bacterium]|nr:MAG: hypothetical protein CM15mP103_03830 [Gammaproteobacteria bacterium]
MRASTRVRNGEEFVAMLQELDLVEAINMEYS